MKTIIRILAVFIIIFVVQAGLSAEALFLKDGSILKGKIVKDTDQEVILKVSGKEKGYVRSKILRVLYEETYDQKVYIFMKDNSVIEGYIVEETRDANIYRTDLASTAEKSVKKDDIRFISKEKLSIYDIQKKTEKPKLIADRKNKFLNLLGMRLGALYTMTENKNVDVKQGDAFMMNVGLYYIDRFFEFNWDIHAGFGDHGAMLHHYSMTFVPLSMFNVELGITIGYTQFDFSKQESDGDSPGVRMNYNSLLLGLYYRWGGWFRLGFDYSMPVGVDADYKYYNGSEWTEAHYSKSDLSFNCHAFIEVFVWTNMSFRLSYRFLGSKIYFDDEDTATPPPDSITVQNHCISLSIGYGLNLF